MDKTDRGGVKSQDRGKNKTISNVQESQNQDGPHKKNNQVSSNESSDTGPTTHSSMKDSRSPKASSPHTSPTPQFATDNDLDNPKEVTDREKLALMLMKDKEPEYTKLHHYTVCCGTWNVNDQAVQKRSSGWFGADEASDIYAIGLQEMDLSKNVYIFGDSAREDEWVQSIENSLQPNTYLQLQRVRLVAMMLVVFVKKSLKPYIEDLQCESVGTGFLGMMGNKGGVAVRFKVRETSICFVNSHLAAHTEECQRRNNDFKDINSKLYFRANKRSLSIDEHDIVFWLGDLNYRISDIETEEVKRLVSIKAYQELLNFDQLSRQMILKSAFGDYQEGTISFKPTFKYTPGTDEWVQGESARTPAWCDRVLWKGDNVVQVEYRSHPEVLVSDHKPVSALFNVGTKVFDRVLEKKVREDVIRFMDQKENEFLPQVSLSSIHIHFDNLKYLDNQQQTITLVNVGQVPVRFSFINKPSESNPCKEWLNIQPSRGHIQVDKKYNLLLEVQINSKTVCDWDSYKIEDIVVMHLEGGKDFFITVSADCQPSFFGLPLTKLVQLHSPITLNNQPDLNAPALGVPKELWFIIDYLFKHGLKQVELFQILGLEKEIKDIREILDSKLTGLSESKLRIHSVAETLLIFLDALPEPVIPYSFYHQCLQSSDGHSRLKIISSLPTCHANVFKYLCAFLREYLSYYADNQSDLRILSHVFSGVLLKSQKSKKRLLSNEQLLEEGIKKTAFLQHFLSNIFD